MPESSCEQTATPSLALRRDIRFPPAHSEGCSLTNLGKQTRNYWISLAGFIVVGLAGNPFTLTAGQFRASVVQVDITPTGPVWLGGYALRRSTGIHDHIYDRIVAMDDADTQFFLISSDVVSFHAAVYDEVMRKVQAQMGIRSLQVWWCTTHTHSAPMVGDAARRDTFMLERLPHVANPEYTSWFEQKLIEGVKEARAKLEPARLGVGLGWSMANINRRARNEQGPVFLGANPDGPVDRQIGLIRLEKANGKLLAVIVNYAMHGTVLGPENSLITGDAPGIVADYVEEKLGAPMLYINGAAGNLGPIYSVTPNFQSGHLEQFKVLLGDKILAANRRISSTTSNVHLSLGEQIIETPRKVGLGWAPDLRAYTRTTSTGEKVVRLPLRFLQINNDIVIWAAPVELFCQIAMKIRDMSPFPYTFYFGYANGWLGYFPTTTAFAHGGYEPATSPFTPQGEGDLIRAVVTHLQGMPR
jgi:neutral ceramidase